MPQNVVYRLNHEIQKFIKKFKKLKCCENFMPRKLLALKHEELHLLNNSTSVNQIHLRFFNLTLSRRWSLSYRNQSIDLFCKSMNWFLYARDLRHERVKQKVSNLRGVFTGVNLKMELFKKIVNGFQRLTIFLKSSVLLI